MDHSTLTTSSATKIAIIKNGVVINKQINELFVSRKFLKKTEVICY